MNGRSEVFPMPLESGLFTVKTFLAFPILTLRQASFDRFRTEQGERIGKKVSGNPKRLKMA
ncbi:MAG: hypothetical protein LBD67_03890 [Candidatus Accumulibacter sp.]|jgi:hypothetical protein|nr:hypothetical protein [Accumulibacter sp.]